MAFLEPFPRVPSSFLVMLGVLAGVLLIRCRPSKSYQYFREAPKEDADSDNIADMDKSAVTVSLTPKQVLR